MATLQKIRSKGALLLIVIGVAMFAFIAEELVRSISSTTNEGRTHIGEVNGKTINQSEFNQLVAEFTDVLKMNGQIPEQESSEISQQVREQVWSQTVQQTIIEGECEKLGLAVTDQEIQETINKGTHPLLSQAAPAIFKNQQGMFDVNNLKQFLSQREEMLNNPQMGPEQREQVERINNCWLFIEKQLKSALLIQKYQTLLANLVISNPIAAKANFEARINETDVVLAGLPYSTIKDEDIKVEDAEIKAKYEEMKELFKTNIETRDAKYIDVAIEASAADKKQLNDEMLGYEKMLKGDSIDAAAIVSQSASLVPYPVFAQSKANLPADVQSRIDSLGVGQQTPIYYNATDNSTNIVKLIAKTSVADSIEFRQIVAAGQDVKKARKSGDSIYNALVAGAPFDSIAKKYNQPATKQWLTGQMYEGTNTMDETNKKYINCLLNGAVGQYTKLEVDGGTLIVQVTDKRNYTDKYNVAVVKRSVDFSSDTENKIFNEFSAYVAGHRSLDELINSKETKYVVKDASNIQSAAFNIGGVQNSREAVQWLYNDKTKVGDISELKTYGENNDHILLVALTAIHEKGYRTLEDENVKNFIKNEIIREKKAEKLIAQLNGKKSVNEVAKLQGAVVDTVSHVTFAAPVMLQKMMAQEFSLSGAISAAAQGKFVSGIKGNAGVYAFQVTKKYKTEEKYDEKKELAQLAQNYGSMVLQGKMNELQNNAEIEDNRYRFF